MALTKGTPMDFHLEVKFAHAGRVVLRTLQDLASLMV
jgi:hypothetical protein